MEKTKSLGLDFTEGNIMPLLLKFMAPILLAQILNSLYNTVDTVVIGRYVGSMGIVAVSLGGKLMFLLNCVSMGIASGGQIMIAQQSGARRLDQRSRTIGTLFSLLLIVSLVLAVVCLALSGWIIQWLNTPAESVESALAYLRITCVGLPFSFGYLAVSSVLNGMGDSRHPLIFIAIAAALNLVLDIVFIVAWGMGAAGTALATVIGQGVSFLVSLILLYRRKEQFGFDFKRGSFRISGVYMREILRLGLPIAAQGGLIQATQLFIMRYINLFGLVDAAAYAIGDKIIHLLNIFCMAVSQAGGSMSGQNFGARKLDRCKGIVYCCLACSISLATVISLVSLLFPRIIFGLFTKDAAIFDFAWPFMLITALCYFLSAIMGSYNTITTGTGNAKLALLAGVLDGVIFRIAFSFFFGYTLHMGVTGFFLGNTLARLGPVIVHGSYYYSGAWKRRKPLVQKEEARETS
jgi:putative MATE family efflux protein